MLLSERQLQRGHDSDCRLQHEKSHKGKRYNQSLGWGSRQFRREMWLMTKFTSSFRYRRAASLQIYVGAILPWCECDCVSGFKTIIFMRWISNCWGLFQVHGWCCRPRQNGSVEERVALTSRQATTRWYSRAGAGKQTRLTWCSGGNRSHRENVRNLFLFK